MRTFADLPGIELWVVRNSARSWTLYHWAYCFAALERGVTADTVVTWRYRRGQITVKPGITALLEPEEVQTTTLVSRPLSFSMLLVAPEHARRAIGRGRAPWFAEAGVEDQRLNGQFHRLCATLQSGAAGPTARARELERFLAHAHACAGQNGPAPGARHTDRAVRRAREFIERGFEGRLSLDEVSAAAGVSKYHLERTFAGQMGVPVWEFVKLVRARRALALLREGARPANVAPVVGFADQAHMNRVFRELFGLTPGQYRAASRRGG